MSRLAGIRRDSGSLSSRFTQIGGKVMCTFCRRLRSLVQGPSTESHPRTTSVAINVDRLRTDAEAAGERDGARNYPSAGAHEWSSTEKQIEARIGSAAQAERERLRKQMQVYGDRLAAVGVDVCVEKFANIPSAIEARYRSLVVKQELLLHGLSKDVTSLADEMRDFKEGNRLKRLAHYPASRRLAYGFLAILVVAESLLNAYFFAKGNELGLIGGGFQALMFALFNVLLGLLLGRVAFPNVHHRNWFRRSVGAVSVLVVLCVGVVFNVWVAHYREAVALHPFEAAQTAVVSFRDAPWGLSQFDSWMLLIVGCTWVVLAAVDAYRMDDPYPGYGKLDRRSRSKQDEYVSEVEHTFTVIEGIRETGLKDLNDALREFQFLLGKYHILVAERDLEVARSRDSLSDLEQEANRVLAAYRTANRRCRTEPTPAYFDQDWIRLPRPPGDLPEPSGPVALRDENALVELQNHRARILAAAQNATDAFKSLEQLNSATKGA